MTDEIVFTKTIEDILPEDYKYISKDPDPNFSPARNKAIIKETIQETEKFVRQLHSVSPDLLNRIDITNSYAVKRLGGETQKSFKDYVGRDLFNKLVGEKIMEKVRIADTINKLNKAAGNTKFKNFILD